MLALPPAMRHEVEELSARYGPSRFQTVELAGNRFLRPSGEAMRDHEVCMVIRRPSRRLLIFKKTFYPPGVYRLLTGGIKPGERILDALHRELQEETGLDVAVRRLLAVVGYTSSGGPPGALTFAFLLDELAGELRATDPDEQVEDFREIDAGELLVIAQQLENLSDEFSEDLESRWSDWGRFRAVIHRIVAEVLETPTVTTNALDRKPGKGESHG